MRRDTITPEVGVQRQFDDLHHPHHRHNEQGDDEAARKLPSFRFVIHDFETVQESFRGQRSEILADFVFLPHEKQRIYCSPCRRYRNGFLGDVIRLVDAGLPEPQPYRDHLPTPCYRHRFPNDNFVCLPPQRENPAETPRPIRHSSLVRAFPILHL